MNVWVAMVDRTGLPGSGQTYATVMGALGWLATHSQGSVTVVVGRTEHVRHVTELAARLGGENLPRLRVLAVESWARPGWEVDGPVLWDTTALHEVGRWGAAELDRAARDLSEARAEVKRRARERDEVTANHDRLRWGVVANAGRTSPARMARWGHVAEATGLGKTASAALCVAAGFDPDEVCGLVDDEDAGDE